MLTEQQRLNLLDAAATAVATAEATNLPARLTVAQWAQESGWGEHAPGCNCFGIKAYYGCYGTQMLKTTEGDNNTPVDQTFATFPSLYACFNYHAQLITKKARYKKAWEEYQQTQELDKFARNIAPIYAPGNTTYADQIIALMHDQRVIDAISQAYMRLQPTKAS